MHTHKYKSILKHRHTHTHIHLHRGWRHACRGLSCVRLSLFLFTVSIRSLCHCFFSILLQHLVCVFLSLDIYCARRKSERTKKLRSIRKHMQTFTHAVSFLNFCLMVVFHQDDSFFFGFLLSRSIYIIFISIIFVVVELMNF